MGEGDAASPAVWTATTRRLAILALGSAAWLASFAVLARHGTWTPFATTGVLLGGLALGSATVPVALLRPSRGTVGLGIVAGLLMVVLTHAAYSGLAQLVPEARVATLRLFEFLNVGGFSAAARAGLIVLIATCEEVLFRGTLPGVGKLRQERHWMVRADGVPIVAFAAVYALATLPLGSPLLVLCAFLCGVVWGGLRSATGSLVAPILTHVIWDLGVLVVWPLVASP